jgi:hypothetical protein
MVRSKRWLIGYTFHHQKSYVVPTVLSIIAFVCCFPLAALLTVRQFTHSDYPVSHTKVSSHVTKSADFTDQFVTSGRFFSDGWSMVRSKRWLIGYTFHHQKSYVVPTLGQPYQPNGWVAHVGPTWDERWHANCDVRPTMPTMYQRWINVLLLTG